MNSVVDECPVYQVYCFSETFLTGVNNLFMIYVKKFGSLITEFLEMWVSFNFLVNGEVNKLKLLLSLSLTVPNQDADSIHDN